MRAALSSAYLCGHKQAAPLSADNGRVAMQRPLRILLDAIGNAKSEGISLWFARAGLENVFQDAGASVAAALSQPVGGIKAISGSSLASQSTDTSRPTLIKNSRAGYALDMSTSQYMLSDTTPNGAVSAIVATSAMVSATTRAPFGCRASSTSDKFFVNHAAAGSVNLTVGTSNGVVTAAVTDGAPCVITATAIEGGNASLYINGLLAGAAAFTGTLKPTCPLAIGALNTVGTMSFGCGMPILLAASAPAVISSKAQKAIERLACLLAGAQFAG